MTINCAKDWSIFRVERWASSRGEIANAACGVGHPRVRRCESSHAATANIPFFGTSFVKDFPFIFMPMMCNSI